MRKLFQIVILAFVLLLCGCQNAASQTKESQTITLDSSSCTPPCWNGITPGKTKRDDLLVILNSIQPNEIRYKEWDKDYLNETITFGYGFKNVERPFEAQYLEFYLTDGIVDAIAINGFDVGFGDYMEYMGEPESIYTFLVVPEAIGFVAAYPSKGIIVFSSDTTSMPGLLSIFESSKITSNSKITYWLYFEPSSYDAVLQEFFNIDKEQAAKYGHSWNGYGKISEKYPLVKWPWPRE